MFSYRDKRFFLLLNISGKFNFYSVQCRTDLAIMLTDWLGNKLVGSKRKTILFLVNLLSIYLNIQIFSWYVYFGVLNRNVFHWKGVYNIKHCHVLHRTFWFCLGLLYYPIKPPICLRMAHSENNKDSGWGNSL